MESTSMFIRLWNPDSEDWEFVPVQVPGKVRNGPQCDYIFINRSKVASDERGNFRFENYNEHERDAVHVYATARLTVDLWERATGRTVIWPWNHNQTHLPLQIERYNELVDAVYYQRYQSIELGTTGPDLKFACRSFDIVAHETTHAIIRAVNPSIYDRATFETYACVEALCDISAFLTLASQPHILEKALTQTGGDLKKKNFLSEFGEGYNKDLRDGIRSALTIQQIPDDPCAMGSKLVHDLYQRMVELFDTSDCRNTFSEKLEKFTCFILTNAAESTQLQSVHLSHPTDQAF